MRDIRDHILGEVDALRDELTAFASELVRIPTVNPPGEAYADCARHIGARLASFGHAVEYYAAEGCPEHTARHPRVNVIGVRAGACKGPVVHLNGHLDVVPAGAGWTRDPFGGEIEGGRVWGRGASDMKAGLAAAIYSVEALRRAGVKPAGGVEVSATVDEESGGQAGVAWLAERGRIAKGRVDYVIIPEPLGVDRICIGHRGVYWFDVETRGRIAHGSMPFLGVSAIDHLGAILEAVRTELRPALAGRRTAMPVVPEGSDRATINVNAVSGGQFGDALQTPCVADRALGVFDRRFLAEEGFERTREEIVALLERVKARVPGLEYALRDRLVVHPTRTPEGSPLIAALRRTILEVLGREARIVASPGTYDQKHVDRIGGVPHCVAYGPGELERAHQPDEWASIDDLVASTKVLALTTLDLAGPG
ncbi:MAG TPA: acetylornithine deacetylase/succinyl-diaminopimelate desuccinylase family protein [Vicinamibacteria bacterium]|nr:acetylornithine deacetylase/succinyl-diaminopimelate desuccinylase family protein [Vicinamibacteria bacterium]